MPSPNPRNPSIARRASSAAGAETRAVARRSAVAGTRRTDETVAIAIVLYLAAPCGLVSGSFASSARAEEPASIVSASSIHAPEYLPEFALDGRPETRWASGGSDGEPEWLEIAFLETTSISKIRIRWEVAHAVRYEVRVSDDGASWSTVATRTGSKGGEESLDGLVAKGRRLRIVCLEPTPPWRHYSIWEVGFPEADVAASVDAARKQAGRIREERRRESLRGVLDRGVREIVFAARPVSWEHWYANFGYYAAQVDRPYFGTQRAFQDGGKLYRADLEADSLTAILDDPKGGVRDPFVLRDGRTILFSYRPAGDENYHLYRVQSDGSGLRRLTDGPWDDIEPAALSDGSVVFVSSRARRWVNCWCTQVATLHRASSDGTDIRPISSNNEHDNTPWPLPDGRILYMRWEYVDRSQVDYHHLWTAFPDGTGQAIYFGNLHPGTVMLDAKPIPGSPKVVASFSPGHGAEEHRGHIAVVDPRSGPDFAPSARIVTPAADYRDPWALSEDCFLAARGPSVVAVGARGEAREILRLPEEDLQAKLEVHEPRPLVPAEPEASLAARSSGDPATGRFFLVDVAQGRNMAGVRRGEVRRLLILETLPKPINFTGGMEPLSYGGTFTLERIVGTVPVEEDGSAYFEAPALRSLVFVALDGENIAVKRMQSFTSVMPGETQGCVGCHEPRTQTPGAGTGGLPAAVRRPPSAIEPVKGVPDVIDFPRDVQPILDRRCLPCHDCDRRDGGLVLSGDRGPHYSLSYYSLTARSLVADGRNRARSNYPPRALGSGGSRLMQHLDRLTSEERDIVRLWIDVGAPYPGTYAALGSGMIGGYAQNQLDRSAEEWPSTKAAAEALRRRCGSCHSGPTALPLSVCDEIVGPPWQDLSPDDPRRRFSRHLLYDLTRPEKSLLLLAPLSRAAGGLGICSAKAGGGGGAGVAGGAMDGASGGATDRATDGAAAVADVFPSDQDPDYIAVLAAISEAKADLERRGRFDMPGFRPRPEWVREMKRFGILSAEHDEAAPVDVYAVERRYWESLWWQPGGSAGS